MNRRKLLLGATALAFKDTLSRAALPKSDWPTRPVKVVVGFSAGGPTDNITRMLADMLGQHFNQSFVVENRLGANGAVAAMHIKSTPADGYTLLLGGSGTMVVAPNLNRTVAYDPLRDFTPISRVSDYPYFLAVPQTSPITSTQALIALAKEKAGHFSYASAGVGAGNHLAAEWFNAAAGIQATHVPYKGDAAALTDVLAGRVDYSFLSGVVVDPYVKTGKLRVLAVSSLRPERGGGVPRVADAGIADFAVEPWTGLFGPAGLPDNIVQTLSVAVNEVMAQPTTARRLESIGQFPLLGGPRVFADYIRVEYARWAKVVHDAGIPIQMS